MIYQLRVNIFTKDPFDFNDVLDKLDDLKPRMIVINPGLENQECSSIETIVCNHGQASPLPCETLFSWDNCPVP